MAIDKEVLHNIIFNNVNAKKLADSGDDTGTLKAIYSILPKEVVIKSLSNELGILGVFANPDNGDKCLAKLEAFAVNNPTFKRIMKWLGPGSPGLDFGNPVVRSQLDALVIANILTKIEVDTIKSLGEKVMIVTVDEISEVWSRYRNR